MRCRPACTLAGICEDAAYGPAKGQCSSRAYVKCCVRKPSEAGGNEPTRRQPAYSVGSKGV